MKNVGVVGCGFMGSGIAQVCAQSGYETVMRDMNSALVERGMNVIKSNLSRDVEKGRITESRKDEILSRLKGTTDLRDFRGCDFVVEAVTEDMRLKKEIFSSLDSICSKHAIIASNTSTLSITEMGSVTKRPGQIVGTHFFYPVPVMKLVEVVKSLSTTEETLNTAKAFGDSLGKTVVVAKDTPGFIVNRLFIPYIIDAIRVYEAGLASREDIDNAIKFGLNYPMGPLTLLDFAGIDTFYYAACTLYEELGEPRFCPPPLLRRMVQAGHLGRKTGKGFYDYTK
ncbi:MAG: 3-hydroxybutyryl-CoA dehydrogenase [Chloroflexi bacterium]|nr:3-hydroxybutyryl-CoA dehydrogenase [Chloroflexota bacterium]